MKRIHDGAIGDIVSIEENFLRAPYGVTDRKPGLTELEWQCSTQYHFRWLSGDDVPQSLVHNLDRASWVLKDAVPVKCHGLGGRSSMTEPIYGDVFDHHSVVYEFPERRAGLRLLPHHDRLLRRVLQPHLGHQRPGQPHRGADLGRDQLALAA